MNTSTKGQTLDRKALLSTIWIFAVLNYLYCDLLSLMDANILKQYLAGNVVGIQFSEGFLLGAGMLMEISMAMVLLSRVLPTRAIDDLTTGSLASSRTRPRRRSCGLPGRGVPHGPQRTLNHPSLFPKRHEV